MMKLGLTGSIGMGKSTTAKMFADAGVPVHDADATVHALYRGVAAAPIEASFPQTTRDGAVDRKALGAQVIGKPEALKRLEAIVHPLVRDAEEAFLEAARATRHRVVVLDIPLLLETGGASRVDAVVVVTADAEIQRARVLERPGMTTEQLDAILARQMPDTDKRRHAHFLIDTGSGLESARRQVSAVLKSVAAMPGKPV
ncbi:dephospho-CoA kinase [Breoghania sp. L-A4]|uniref:dephospho-CoA kinase n=1 Tax=Breoghania sp. L-A4 TaxID=2304600 RepID=UPI000E35CD99|nr:dephospho-CoA kinase [Breoghania sp. L-A4]AXS38817.1 dephospho-CoA kinase [Breoghania sp. L-A4]